MRMLNLYGVKRSLKIWEHGIQSEIISIELLEIIYFTKDKVKFIGRKASSSTATGNLNKHLAQQKEILEKVLRD